MTNIRNRVTVLIAGVVIQLCIGIYYIWSVFQEPVMVYLDMTSGQASATFYTMIVMNVAGNMLGGRLYDKKGAHMTIFLGGMLFTLGIFLSSFVSRELPWLIYVTYGTIAGFGSGIVYTTNISCSQKWWIDKKGLASGIIVSAFGASTIIFAPIVNTFIVNYGVSVTFRLLAAIFAVTFMALGVLIKDPLNSQKKNMTEKMPKLEAQKQYTPKETLKSKEYYLILICLMLLPPTYYILNPLFKTLGEARGLSKTFAVGGIMFTGIASAAGRFIAAKLSDYIGSKNVIRVLYLIMMVSVILIIFAQGYWFTVVTLFIALAYGGCAGITPVLTVDYFGTKNIGAIFGLMMIAIMLSGLISPIIANAVSFNGTPSEWTFIIPAIACVVGLIVASVLKDPGTRQSRRLE